MKNLIQRIKTKLAQRRCAHEFDQVTITGKIGQPQMHPHPLFCDRIQVRLQPIANVKVCFHCQKLIAHFGHNEHSVEPSLPGLESN